jgi:hypothetical protein
MARRIYAGADLFLMPSRFEPCGQGQMIALRYGTPPIVRRTGGLADTIVDADADPETGTGFVFEETTPAAFLAACERAMARFARGGTGWSDLVALGMAVDFDWRHGSAPAYLAAYGRAAGLRTAALAAAGRGENRRRRRHTPDRLPCGGSGMANQFVVQLKNEAGSMAALADALAARGVDLRAIGGGGTGDTGHVIMTTADDDTTREVLDGLGYTYLEGESLLTEVADQPGGMAAVLRGLADAGVNVHGHLFIGRWGDRAMFAFVVDKPEVARPILERKA